MANISVTVDKAQLARVEKDVEGIRRGVPRVLVRAINKVGKRQRTKLSKLLAKETGLPKRAIDEKNVIWKGANYKKLEGKIVVRGGGIPVMKLSPRQTRKGVTYKGPGNRRVLIPKAFIATVKAGKNKDKDHKSVFARVRFGRAGWRSGLASRAAVGIRSAWSSLRAKSGGRGVTPEGYAWRLPIKKQYSPGALQQFQPILRGFQNETASQLYREIETQTALVVASGRAAN